MPSRALSRPWPPGHVYLTHWHRMHREPVIVTIDEFHGAPLQLVETAAAQRSADLRAAKRGKWDAYD